MMYPQPHRQNLRRHPMDLYDLKNQLRGGPIEEESWASANWWMAGVILLFMVLAVVGILSVADWLDSF